MMNDLITRSFDAANAYGSTQKTMQNAFNMGGISGGSQPDVVTSFGDALTKALKDAIDTGRVAEHQSALGLSGGGNLSTIATSVEEAKLTLQTVTTLRDRIVQAYQEVMRMTI
ncbi:MAG: flagellar hook-basal body complex protein FliE [Acetobacter sp.]|nr:flagellar hook-basal body complex protein FliE [Acetobacter sp.]